MLADIIESWLGQERLPYAIEITAHWGQRSVINPHHSCQNKFTAILAHVFDDRIELRKCGLPNSNYSTLQIGMLYPENPEFFEKFRAHLDEYGDHASWCNCMSGRD